MTTHKTKLIRLTFDSLYYTQFYQLFDKSYAGVGVIFTLHHVVKEENSSNFAVNRLLEITPDFLEQTILQVKALGYDIISLDEMWQRMAEQQFDKKFICFTLDDGYIDNYEVAFPIFKKHNIPFAIYVSTGIIEGKAILWWRCLEKVILKEDNIEININGELKQYKIDTLSQKQKVFDNLYWQFRAMPLSIQHKTIFDLMANYDCSVEDVCKNSAMTWEMLEELAKCPLATIGAHTVNHLAMAKLSVEAAKKEVISCCEVLNQRLNINVNHFCYPYGDPASASEREFAMIKELGFKTATTTRKAVVERYHKDHLQALPRIPLNGFYQKQRYVRLLLSGVPTGLWGGLKRRVFKKEAMIKIKNNYVA